MNIDGGLRVEIFKNNFLLIDAHFPSGESIEPERDFFFESSHENDGRTLIAWICNLSEMYIRCREARLVQVNAERCFQRTGWFDKILQRASRSVGTALPLCELVELE